MKESDLYLPLKRFLESQNYEVKGEVQNCDALAVRGKEAPVVVELKLSLNLDVVLFGGTKVRTQSPRTTQLITTRPNNRLHADAQKRAGEPNVRPG
jgi:hypothetical protein